MSNSIKTHRELLCALLQNQTLVSINGDEIRFVDDHIECKFANGRINVHSLPPTIWSVKSSALSFCTVPKAEISCPKMHQVYYCPSLDGIYSAAWTGSHADMTRLRNRVVHLSYDAANTHRSELFNLA